MDGFEALGILLEARGVKPKPPREALVSRLALEEVGFETEGFPTAAANEPSLVPGLLLRSLPFLLKLEAGLGGGPIGLSTGEKKLDLRLPFGVVGTFCRLSTVRSLRDDREGLWCFAGAPKGGRSGGGSVGDSSRKPCRDAERKLSSELS